MWSVISYSDVWDKSNRHVTRLTHHSDKILAVLHAISLKVGFEGHFHLINIQYHAYKNMGKNVEELVKEAEMD